MLKTTPLSLERPAHWPPRLPIYRGTSLDWASFYKPLTRKGLQTLSALESNIITPGSQTRGRNLRKTLGQRAFYLKKKKGRKKRRGKEKKRKSCFWPLWQPYKLLKCLAGLSSLESNHPLHPCMLEEASNWPPLMCSLEPQTIQNFSSEDTVTKRTRGSWPVGSEAASVLGRHFSRIIPSSHCEDLLIPGRIILAHARLTLN